MVAQGGGTLELEFLGGFAHLDFELRENFTQLLLAGYVRIGEVFDGDRYVVSFHNRGQLHVHGLDNRLWRDAVRIVVSDLFRAAAIGLPDGLYHRAGHAIGVENSAGLDVPRAAADGLDERRGAAQVAFLVGIEDSDERDFGEVEALAEQVNADQG